MTFFYLKQPLISNGVYAVSFILNLIFFCFVFPGELCMVQTVPVSLNWQWATVNIAGERDSTTKVTRRLSGEYSVILV